MRGDGRGGGLRARGGGGREEGGVVEEFAERGDGAVEVEGGDETDTPCGGGLKGGEAITDGGAREPEGEGVDGGGREFGDGGEGVVLAHKGVEELGLEIGGGVEGGERGHGLGRVRCFGGLSIGI